MELLLWGRDAGTDTGWPAASAVAAESAIDQMNDGARRWVGIPASARPVLEPLRYPASER